MENIITKTQELLSPHVQKAPLTEKLLGKPPFRFLHDVISELSASYQISPGQMGFTEAESNAASITDKDAKIAYLSKVIEFISSKTGVNVEAKPNKIVAGLEPELTNVMLQELAQALVVAAKAPLEKQESKSQLNKDPEIVSRSNSRLQLARQTSTPDVSKSTGRTSSRETLNNSTAAPPKSRQAPPSARPTTSSGRKPPVAAAAAKPSSRRVQVDNEATHIAAASQEALVDESLSAEGDAKEKQGASNTPPPSRPMRPTTARHGPPRAKKDIELTEVPPTATAPIIRDSGLQARIKEEEDNMIEIVGDEANASTVPDVVDDGVHGALVRRLMDNTPTTTAVPETSEGTDTTTITSADKLKALKDIQALKETIQTLCRSTNPLGKTLDYVQEDLDSMQQELVFWRDEYQRTRQKLDESLRLRDKICAPLQNQLQKLDADILDAQERLIERKRSVLQNEQLLQQRMSAMLSTGR